MHTKTESRIGDAVFVPCMPYQTDIYDMDIMENWHRGCGACGRRKHYEPTA
jgi:hypothetical protein